MTNKEKANVAELIDMTTKVPKDKREYLMGYMQCMVDLNDGKRTKRRKNIKNSVSTTC